MKSDIKRIERKDANFPSLLKEIPGAPEKLFVRGDIKSWPEKAVAIVGTRKATTLGLKIAEEFAEKLARAGLTIVSGLAMGIDTASHKGALKAGGKTIAVLGCGIDRVYPAQNENLAAEIITSHGAIISEHPPGTVTYKSNFLDRNRIVSGLCLATILIEVPIRSGALRTAGTAGEQGRHVLVVPGPINHPNYRGSHALIRDGATLVTSAEEVLEDLGFESDSPASTRTLVGRGGSKSVDIFLNNKQSAESIKIMEALRNSARPLTLDEIIDITGLDSGTAAVALGSLSIAQIVLETPAGYILGKQ